jgi:hypothetical protein
MRRSLIIALVIGAAVWAAATAAGDEDHPAVEAAALKLVPGGTVNAVERDGEKGATWEVEVRKPDGSTVDVRLDANLQKVAIDRDSEGEDR